MLYQLFIPTPELADIVACYWYAPIEANHYAKQRYATPLFESLVFNFTHLKECYQYEGKTIYISKAAYIFGQTKSCSFISGIHEKGGTIIGVRFKPLGLAKITGINMVHLTNKVVDAEEVWGSEFNSLCEAMQEAKDIGATIGILEHFLKIQFRTIRLPSRVDHVAQAITLMETHKGNISCETLQNLTNTGRKALERSFMQFHGMNPKKYIQIIRFNMARQMMEDSPKMNLMELETNPGYFDRSHFNHAFKKFSGQTPTEYLKTLEEERRKRTIPVD